MKTSFTVVHEIQRFVDTMKHNISMHPQVALFGLYSQTWTPELDGDPMALIA
jgi:hypothetical protein